MYKQTVIRNVIKNKKTIDTAANLICNLKAGSRQTEVG